MAIFQIGEQVTITIGGRIESAIIVNTKTTKDHFRRYIVRTKNGKHHEVSLGQLARK